MADDTDARAIQQAMDRILGELCADGFSGRAGNAQRRTALEREYQDLARRLPKTGAQADVLEIRGRIGSGFIPRPVREEPESWDSNRDGGGYEPLRRFVEVDLRGKWED